MSKCLLRCALAGSVALQLAGCGGGGEAPSGEATLFQPVAGQLLRKADLNSPGARFTGNGWYWNPAESGTGLLFEAQGTQAVFGYYAYDDAGEPIWYTAAGTFAQTATGFSFSGSMHSFTGGQPASSRTFSAPVAQLVGPVSGTFSGTGADSRVSMTLPGGRVLNFQRFNFGDIRFAPGPMQAETGWYWNRTETGRGYGLEIQGNQVVAVMFHYRSDGKPVWNAVQGDFTTGVMEAASFLRYSGGQTLTGAYRTPAGPTRDGSFGLFFSAACQGAVKLPGSADWTAIERFAFGTDQPCRATANGDALGSNQSMTTGADYWFTSQERIAYNVLNVERTRCGFGALVQDKRLDQAAKAHLDYMIQNNVLSHDETPGRPGFTGVTPGARGVASGYGERVWEINARWFYSSGALAGSSHLLKYLFALPYHTIGALSVSPSMGVAWGGADGTSRINVNFGNTTTASGEAAPQVLTYPCEGSVGVFPVGRTETPSPFPSEASPRWGQPIIVKGSSSLRVQSVTLTGPAGEVPLKARYGDGLTTDPNDRCKSGWACIIPAELQPFTVYTAAVSGTDNGVAFTRRFLFKTGTD